jgi:prepilin-type N-terminal cleavage/methylation domain-containing protein
MRQHRRGFTLVEVLVSLALTVFILAILSQAFGTGADTFRTLKTVGDLNASLRTATTMLRSDLSAPHFEGQRRISDANYWRVGPPVQGYFYLSQGTTAPTTEGLDVFLNPSRRASGTVLAMTVRATGTRPQNFYEAPVPAGSPLISAGTITTGMAAARYQDVNSFSSQWIEVNYFLQPLVIGGLQLSADGSTPLYALYRQQRMVVGDNGTLNWGANAVSANLLASYQPYVSCQANATNANNLYFNSPADLTIPQRRTATACTPLKDATNNPTGTDLLLTDVLSFDVKVLTITAASTTSVPPVTALPTDTDFGDLPTTFNGQSFAAVFDTWSRRKDDAYDYSARSTAANNPYVQAFPMPTAATSATALANPIYRIVALQITVRIWDPRTKLARQISIVQAM